MDIRYYLVKNATDTAAKAPYTVRVVPNGVANLNDLVAEILTRISSSEQRVRMALAEAAKVMLKHVLAGETVDFGGIRFKAQIPGSMDYEDSPFEPGVDEVVVCAYADDELRGTFDGIVPAKLSAEEVAAITGVSIFLAHDFIEKRGVLESNTPAPEDDATKVTSAHLEERNADVRALLKKQKDRFGMAIPEKLLHAFLSTEPKKVAKQLKALRKMSEQRIFSGDLAFVGLGQQFLINLDNAIRNLKYWTPFCVCRGCRGEGCYRCSNHGFQSRSQYDMNPPELKAEENR